MLQRILETEVMDTASEAEDYDAMDHTEVNRVFVDDFCRALRAAGFRLEPESASSVPLAPETAAPTVPAAVSAGPSGVSGPGGGTDVIRVADVGTGPAQIPIALCRRVANVHVDALDLARHMLRIAQCNVDRAALGHRIRLLREDAKRLNLDDASYDAVMSNSIVHHIPDPLVALKEMVRIVRPGGVLFVRDLLRPATEAELQALVATYAAQANAHQRQMFRDSLHAALTVAEMRSLAERCGLPAHCVRQTSDRHWTLCARRPAA